MRALLLSFGIVAVCTTLAGGASRDLRGKDWTGKDLQNENLAGADLSDSNLQAANLGNASLKNANLQRADLRGARLKTADLTGADLRGARLGGNDLDSARFVKANLEADDVYLAYGNPVDAERNRKAQRLAEDANVPNSALLEHNGDLSFKEANLRRAKLHGSMEGVDFRRADLRGADLSDTKDASKAELRGAIYDDSTRWPSGFDVEESHAVRGEKVAAESAGTRSTAPPSLTGKWLIKSGPDSAPEEGILTIKSDGSYTWDYSVKADPVAGHWKKTGGGISLVKGEAGHDWEVIVRPHGDRSDAIELRAADASLKRWAVPAGN
jgi:hypothetical protein